MAIRIGGLLDRWRAALRRREEAAVDVAQDAPDSTGRLIEAEDEEADAHAAYDDAVRGEERHWEDEPG